MTPDEIKRLKGQQAEGEEERKLRLIREAPLMAGAKLSAQEWRGMQNANPYRDSEVVDHAIEQRPTLCERIIVGLKRVFRH